LVKLSRVDEGLRALDRAIELDPRLTEARVARAQVLARNGQADLARRDQVEAQRINAADAAVGRAMILIESGRTRARDDRVDEAIADFREAAAVCPELAEAHYQLGKALMNVPGQAGAAEAALQRAVDLDPSRADAYYGLGLLRGTRGDEAQATEALLRATTLKPSLVDAHRALADAARSRGDWPTAIAELEIVLAWEPADVRAREARASAIDAQAREAQRR
jgi:tetratricopeptide (TPR) repeat protein